jgi:hypothetical protein
LKHARGKALCVGLQMATSSRLLVKQWAPSPRGISCYLVSGFTPSTARFVHNNITSREVSRVFVLRCQSASHPTYLVSFHRVACHIQFIQSYKLHPYIHAFIQSYIHTLILSRIHTFIYTQHIHNINSYRVASVIQSLV